MISAPDLLRVIDDALDAISANSRDARVLVFGTACVESNRSNLFQHHGGPALGLWQMEPATHDDIWENYLMMARRGSTRDERRIALGQMVSWHPLSAEQLAFNIRYAAAMCRVKYLRDREPLPSYFDIGAQGEYWKRVYNTHLGKGRPVEYARRIETVWRSIEVYETRREEEKAG